MTRGFWNGQCLWQELILEHQPVLRIFDNICSKISKVVIKNYNDANMHVILESKPDPKASFGGSGKVIYRVRDQQVVLEKSPVKSSGYVEQVKSAIYHLHFGDLGGRPLRVIYFVLGTMGCLVIISGILIWLVARDKSNVAPHKRAFNLWTANIFMASCLSMLPVTAFTMISLKFIAKPTQEDIYHLYFYAWLVLSVYLIVRKKLSITNKQTLVLSAVLCMAVPIVDGITCGNWFWNTFTTGASDILFIDVLFCSLSLLCILVLAKMKAHQAKGSSLADRMITAKPANVPA